MTLLLDGEQVRCKNMKATANLRIESGDMSGQTSNSDTAHTGFKPKTLTFSGLIRHADADWLRTLMRLAEATESGGQLKTYRIVHDTAAAFGMRQVQFSDGVSSREHDTLQAWLIQFTLTEKLSNPERVEGRRTGNTVASQSAPGQGVAGESGSDPEKPGQELTGFESVLKKIDNWMS